VPDEATDDEFELLLIRGVDRGGLWGLKPPRNVGWGPTPGVMGGPRQGCRQGNGGFVVRWWVVCGKNVKID
jgi:hypothetical protein